MTCKKCGYSAKHELKKVVDELEEKLTMATETEGWNKDASPAFEERNLNQFRKGQISVFRWIERKVRGMKEA